MESSESTSEDSITYTHTFPIVETLEQPPVIIECKPTILYDIWCYDRPVNRIKLVDVLDTIAKPIHSTQCECDISWETFINTPGSNFRHQGYLCGQHVHHKMAFQ
jgi:hypothetical protein